MTGRDIYGLNEKKYSVMLKTGIQVSYKVDSYTVTIKEKELCGITKKGLPDYRTGRNTHTKWSMVTSNNILSANESVDLFTR